MAGMAFVGVGVDAGRGVAGPGVRVAGPGVGKVAGIVTADAGVALGCRLAVETAAVSPGLAMADAVGLCCVAVKSAVVSAGASVAVGVLGPLPLGAQAASAITRQQASDQQNLALGI